MIVAASPQRSTIFFEIIDRHALKTSVIQDQIIEIQPSMTAMDIGALSHKLLKYCRNEGISDNYGLLWIYFKDTVSITLLKGIVAFALLVSTSALATIVPADRITTWNGNVGIPGGIPNRTTIYKNMVTAGADNKGGTDCSAILQNAINTCPANQVIYFPAGTYRINGFITNPTRSNITIRGAGMGGTRLMLYSGVANGAFDIGASDWPRPVASLAITGGATAGSNRINLLNTSSITVGKLIRIEQTNPAWVKQLIGLTNNMSFLFKVTAKTSNSVTFSPPLPFTLTNFPKLAVYPRYPIQGVGIEGLTFDLTYCAASSAVFLEQAYGCWFKGVEVYHANSRQIWMYWTINCEIRECYTHDTRSSGPNHEGIDLYQDDCWNLIENNTCVKGGFPMIVLGDSKGGCSGNVVGYNYCYNIDTGTSLGGAEISVNHGPHNMMNLFEGNIASGFISDGYYGSSSHNTVFRNWFNANHPTITQHLIAVNLDRWSDYFNIVGNVLGYSGFPASPNGLYETKLPYPYSTRLIYRLGFPNLGNTGFSGTWGPNTPPNYANQIDPQNLDRNVKNTVIRHGNYDYSTHKLNWDPNIVDHILPNSYYLADKPSWFGNLTWPPIDPTKPSLAAATSIPAGYRYANSTLSLQNISTRAFVNNGDQVLIAGFIITGTGQKKVMVRALGPSLPVSPALSDPIIELRDARGALVASNDNWRTSQQDAIIATGLAPANDRDSVLLATLNPGSYTVVVRGANNATGIGLVEVYDLDDPRGGARLGNVSTRGNVLTGDGVLIGGFILGGGGWSSKIVARAIGPSLGQSGISGVLADPTLELHDANGTLVASNDNWKDRQQAEIQATGIAPSNDRESAILMTLAPGNYTVIVAGKNGGTGVGLVDIYNLY
jgi:hypothetical protein